MGEISNSVKHNGFKGEFGLETMNLSTLDKMGSKSREKKSRASNKEGRKSVVDSIFEQANLSRSKEMS